MKKKECGLNGLNSWLNVCWNVKNRKLQRYWLCIEKQRVCSMVISVVEIEVRGKFICLQSMREEILKKKKWKFFCGDVELMEFSIKKSTATKVGWDERGYCRFGSVWAKRWEMIVYYKCNSAIIVLSYKYF